MRRRRLAMVLVALALVVMSLGGFVVFQDPDRYRDEVASLLGEAAGHPVNLSGPLKLSWRPSPTLSVSGVSVDAPSARVLVDSVQVRVEPAALLSRQFRAREVRVEGVSIDLAAGDSMDTAKTLPDPANVPVDHLFVDNLTVRRDGKVVFRVSHLELREPDTPRGARLDLVVPTPGGEITGKMRILVSGGSVRLNELALTTPVGHVDGSLAISLATPRPRVVGALSADALAFALPWSTGVRGTRLFTQHPLDLTGLNAVDASVRVRIGRLAVGRIRLSDMTLPVVLSEGRLGSTVTATFATGVVNAVIEADVEKSAWNVSLDLNQANAGDALVMLGMTEAEKGGRLDLHAALRAQGTDTRALLSSLAGGISVDASQLHVRAGAAKLAGSDVLATLARTFRGADGNRISVECAVARLAVRDGVASTEEGIGAQTRTMNILGSGEISLPEERIDLVFRPWPREGLGLSASTLVGAVGVTGHLADPRVGLTSDAALRGGATAGAALLTGGLSLIAQGLLERTRGDVPCRTAAGQSIDAAAKSPRATGALEEAKRATGQVGDAVKGIGQSLKGLFGGSGQGGGGKPKGSEQ